MTVILLLFVTYLIFNLVFFSGQDLLTLQMSERFKDKTGKIREKKSNEYVNAQGSLCHCGKYCFECETDIFLWNYT